MSPVPSEPEKYSIDEMMDRLKQSTSENQTDGELVTRSDGSQAIRVRKRKRRSTQPEKNLATHSNRARIMQVSAALVLVFIAALIIGAAIIYANSSPFREGLAKKIAQTTGASVELEQFRMNPETANATKLSLQWPDGNVLKNLTLDILNAEIFPSSFLGKSFNGEEISVTVGTLSLQIPKPNQALWNAPVGDEASPIHFNRYRIPLFHLTLGEPTAPTISLSKSELSLNPENKNGHAQLSLYQGEVAIEGWPKLRLDRALVEFRGRQAEVIGLRLHHETDDRGSLEFSGTVSPYEPDHVSTLAVELESFQLSGLTGLLGNHFVGRVDSTPTPKSNYFSFLPTTDPSPTLDIAFQTTPASQMEVQGFPFLFALAQKLDDPWFERPVFEADAGGNFHRENGIVTLRNLNFENKGRMALRGEISLAPDQSLSGKLQVGVAEAMIVSSKDARLKSMFGAAQNGFRWVTINIGGPAASPTDNFKDLFSASIAPPPPTTSDQEPAGKEGSSFEELTRPK